MQRFDAVGELTVDHEIAQNEGKRCCRDCTGNRIRNGQLLS